MIDFCVLHYAPATQPEWWEACLASARAVETAGLGTLYVTENDADEPCGVARARSLAQSPISFPA